MVAVVERQQRRALPSPDTPHARSFEAHGYCASSTTYNAPSCIATSTGRQGGSDVARTRRDGTGEEAVEVGAHGDLGVVRAELPEAAAAPG